MKKKKSFGTKLIVEKETISQLDANNLAKFKGGNVPTKCCPSAQTITTKPPVTLTCPPTKL